MESLGFSIDSLQIWGMHSSQKHDNRIGCAVLIEAMKRKDPVNTLYFVFSSQEEVGLRGARTSAYTINPDLGIALDVTLTGDMPEAHRMEVSLGKGAAIKVKDSSMITHPKVKDLLVQLAEEGNIPYQMEVLERGGTDAGAIHSLETVSFRYHLYPADTSIHHRKWWICGC